MRKERMMMMGGGGGGGGLSMWVNFLVLVAMVVTNFLSLYHLSTITATNNSNLLHPTLSRAGIPEQLLTQLATIRSSISHLTTLRASSSSSSSAPSTTLTTSPELLLYSKISPIATACHHHPDLLQRYMNYTPFRLCPPLSPPDLLERLILHGCHPLPRRRCFSRTAPSKTPLPLHPFPSTLPDSALLWPSASACKSFSCIHAPGFDMNVEAKKFLTQQSIKSNLDLTIQQFSKLAEEASATPIRLALDVGGGTGTFAARMKVNLNATVLTTTMNLGGLPNNEAAAIRGVVPLHIPLQQRFPVHDGVLDLVRCGHAVNRWIPTPALDFLMYDVDRVLRSGGLFWIDHFLCKGDDLEGVYGPMVMKFGYRILKWTVGNKTMGGGKSSGDVYLTALLQKHGGK